MSIASDAWEWVTTAEHWSGSRGVIVQKASGAWDFANDSILALTLEHLYMSLAAVSLAALVALPVGVYLGHIRRGGGATVVITNISRAMPTLALLTLFSATHIGFGNNAVILAAAIFAFPPILTNAFTGVQNVDADVRDAAVGTGMSARQVMWKIEAPLARPLIAAGLRTAIVQTVATVPLAALVAGGGLGVIINTGLATQRYGQALAGGILVACLSIGIDALLGRLERRLTPTALRAAAKSPA